MVIKGTLLILLCILTFINGATAQCTFQSQFRDTTWNDNTKGTLVFTETTMTGWNFKAFTTTINSWECLDNSSSNYLILKSLTTVSWSTNNFYAYLCLKLTSITDYSYYYYQMFREQGNAGRERVKIAKSTMTVTSSEVCDTSFSGPDTEFHVLVKSGFEASAAVTCPESLLFSGDYLYLNNDGSFDCNDTTDVMDVCTDSTTITFDYTKCSQKIGYSENGSFYCLTNFAFGGYDYVVLYNRDSTITQLERDSNTELDPDTDTTRFSCFCTDGTTASVSPHNCTTYQTPNTYPTLADMTTVNGYLLAFNGTKYVTCLPTTSTATTTSSPAGGGLSSGAIAAIVIVIILLVVALIVITGIYCYLRNRKNRNRVSEEMEKPILERNGVQPRVETIDETAKGNKLLREKSTLSRDGTLAGLKNEKAELPGMQDPDKTKEEKPFLGLFSFCPCNTGSSKSVFARLIMPVCPCGKNSDTLVTDGEDTEKTDSKIQGAASKKGPAVKGSKLATKEKKGSKSKAEKAKKGKAGKDKNKKQQSNTETQTEKSTVKSKDHLTKSDIIIVNTPRPGSPSKGVETINVDKKTAKTDAVDQSPKPSKKKKDKADKEKETVKTEDEVNDMKKEKTFAQEKSKLFREKTDVSAVSSVKRPGTVLSISGIESTLNIEQNIRPQPTQKKKFLDWNFLVCLQRNRSPDPQVETNQETASEPPKLTPKKPGKSTNLKGKKGEKKGGQKGGKKGREKGDTSLTKKDLDAKAVDEIDLQNVLGREDYAKMPDSGRAAAPPDTEIPSVERSKTLPLRREETTVTLQDGKIAVDVYVPDEKTTLQLKDTVRSVEDKTGKDTIKGIKKAKTTLGTTRPDSSKEKNANSKPGKSEKTGKTKKLEAKMPGSKTDKPKSSGVSKKKKKQK